MSDELDDDFLVIYMVTDTQPDWRPTALEEAAAIAKAKAEGKTSCAIGPGCLPDWFGDK